MTQSLQAESGQEQSSVNALSSFASLQMPSLSAAPAPQSNHSWRQIAGLDNNGNQKQGLDFGSIVDSDDGSSD